MPPYRDGKSQSQTVVNHFLLINKNILNEPFKNLILVAMVCLSHFKAISQDCSDVCTWPKVCLSNSTFSCSDYENTLYDDFSGTDLNSQIWKTYRFSLNHPTARLNHQFEEQLYMDENVSVDNGKCKLTGKFEPGTT